MNPGTCLPWKSQGFRGVAHSWAEGLCSREEGVFPVTLARGDSREKDPAMITRIQHAPP